MAPPAQKLVFPLKKYRVSGLGFKDKVAGGRINGIHLGEDARASAGEPVMSIGSGEVVYSAIHPGSPQKGNWGNIVIVRHHRKKVEFFSLYGHLDTPLVKAGAKVKSGQKIALTGPANTPQNGWWPAHLHFAIYLGPWTGAVLPGYFQAGSNRTKLEYWTNPGGFIRKQNTASLKVATMAKIKSIVFDLGGVVVGPFLGEQLIDYASPRLGIDKKELYDLIWIYEADLQKGKLDHVTAWKKILAHKNKEVSDKVLERLRLAPYRKTVFPNKEVVELVKELRRNYTVGCISNTQEPHVSHNRKLGLYDLFDVCILSCEVGMRKPDKEIFDLYMEKTGFKPNEIVFIDDERRLLVNVKKLGITPIHFQGIGKLKSDLRKLKIKYD